MVIYTFRLFHSNRIIHFMLFFGTLIVTLFFFLVAYLVIFENNREFGMIVGLFLILLSVIISWDMVLYRVEFTANQMIIKRLLGRKQVFNLWDIHRKMELDIFVGGAAPEWKLSFYAKNKRYKIRHANKKLVTYLMQIGFVIPDHEKVK